MCQSPLNNNVQVIAIGFYVIWLVIISSTSLSYTRSSRPVGVAITADTAALQSLHVLCVLSFGILQFSCCPWSNYTVAFLYLSNWLNLGTTLDFYISFAHSLFFFISFSSFLYSDDMCMCRKESFVDFMLYIKFGSIILHLLLNIVWNVYCETDKMVSSLLNVLNFFYSFSIKCDFESNFVNLNLSSLMLVLINTHWTLDAPESLNQKIMTFM